MKLQYLGDARDAFKWYLLHWICTTSPFSKLVYVPLLTPDDKDSHDGRISHHQFECQDFIRPFLDSLKKEPRSLRRISALGTLNPEKQFEVFVFEPERFIGSGAERREYWADFDASTVENSVAFFDPDNGYETKVQYEKNRRLEREYIGHDELRNLFAQLPETSVAVVYQHKPHRKWSVLFADLVTNLNYAHTAAAARESNLAFVAMAGNAAAGKHIATAMTQYAGKHRVVDFTSLF